VTCKSGECFSGQEDCFCVGKEKYQLKNLRQRDLTNGLFVWKVCEWERGGDKTEPWIKK